MSIKYLKVIKLVNWVQIHNMSALGCQGLKFHSDPRMSFMYPMKSPPLGVHCSEGGVRVKSRVEKAQLFLADVLGFWF